MKCQAPQAAAPNSGMAMRISRICSPAISMTMSPDAAINSAVPKSGWVTIMAVGTAIKTPITIKSKKVGGKGRSCMYQAQAIGTASFMISDG